VWLQNIDSRDLGWKIFGMKILGGEGQKSRSPTGMTEEKQTAKAKGCADRSLF
jgi:hypothetical protein